MDTSVYLDNSDETASLYRQRAELQAEAARLREALKKACEAIDSLDDDALGMANVGNRYQWPIRDELLAHLQAVLDESISVTPAATNRENDKQPQCGHPRAALDGEHCLWCVEVEAARLQGYAKGRAEGAAAERERACKAICSMCRNDDPILKDGHWIHFRPNVGPGGICSQWCRAAAIRAGYDEEAQK